MPKELLIKGMEKTLITKSPLVKAEQILSPTPESLPREVIEVLLETLMAPLSLRQVSENDANEIKC